MSKSGMPRDAMMSLDVVHPNAAGIDIGNAAHYVAVPPDRDAEPVRTFECFTEELHNNSFRPTEEICVLRTYWRQRDEHVKSARASLQRMQKVLTEMNVQIANVITDISGVTGMAILNAILGGERDRYKLAALADPRVQASQEEIAKSLEGNWRPELLFILRQQMQTYGAYQKRIEECDEALAAHLMTMEDKAEPGSQPPLPKAGKRAGGNAPQFNLRGELYRISGIDLTRIDGINVMIAQTLVAEVGLDMSKWPTEAHFASWLGLCPDNKITGGKVYHRGSRHVENRAATAFRLAATSLWRSKTYLGAKFKRLRATLGAPKAITAMAHTLATPGISHASVRPGLRRQRQAVLPAALSTTANQLDAEEGQRFRPRHHPGGGPCGKLSF